MWSFQKNNVIILKKLMWSFKKDNVIIQRKNNVVIPKKK